jgi:hypothetical protein
LIPSCRRFLLACLPVCGPRRYVNLDDCWLSKNRTATGDLQVDPRAFPDGLEPVIKHVHDKGLKFGLYLSCGNITCQGRAGSWGYEEQDAQYIAKLGVDYLKCLLRTTLAIATTSANTQRRTNANDSTQKSQLIGRLYFPLMIVLIAVTTLSTIPH